ncbi:MAG: hypothetical protein ACX930_02230 [Erythrobacter sp.]
MNRVALAALGSLAVAACGESAREDAAAPQADSSEAYTAIVQPMVPGFYAIESDEVVYSRTRLAEDGSYTDYDGGDNVVGGGKWRSEGAEICFDPEGDGENEQESCWTNAAPGEDGSFVTTLVDGDTSYVVRPLGE